MANVLDYLDWRGDLSFDVSPFNEVDNFILSQAVTPDYTGLVPEDGTQLLFSAVAGAYFEQPGKDGKNADPALPKDNVTLLKKLAACRRFESLRISCYENVVVDDINEQFAAVTLVMPGRFAYIAYRGTDDSIAGWREDCCMAFTEEIPAREDALRYLREMAARISEPLILGGHSKGGNLAVYAAAKAPYDVQKRILHVYSNDGPGFNRSFFETEEYLLIRSRVTAIMPKWSIIGAIFEQDCEQVITECSKQGLLAHNGFTWKVLGTQFVRAESLVKSSRAFKLGMSRAMKGLSDEEKRAFTNHLFDSLTVTGARTISDLTKLKPREALQIGSMLYDHREILIVISRILQESLYGYREELFPGKDAQEQNA